MIEFKDKFTLDGIVTPAKGVTVESVTKVRNLVEAAKRGSYVAEAQLKESLMSGDLAASVAHLINVITIPQLPDDTLRPVAKLAGFRTVSDFRPAILYSLFGNFSGPGVLADGSAPRVPQGTPYPVVSISGIESAYSKIAKRGQRVNWDFEDMVNDTIGVLDGLPAEMQEVALKTEWSEVGDAILSATTELVGITLPDGTVVPPNAAVTPDGIFAAMLALSLREVNSHKIGTLSGYNVVVPVGRKIYVDYQLRQAMNIVSVTNGTVEFGSPDNSALSSVEVIEHDAVTGSNWYLLPKPGAYRRPVLDVLRLRGYETPQIRVRNEGGDSLSFDADTGAFRLRMVTGAALWAQEPVVHSTGSGTA